MFEMQIEQNTNDISLEQLTSMNAQFKQNYIQASIKKDACTSQHLHHVTCTAKNNVEKLKEDRKVLSDIKQNYRDNEDQCKDFIKGKKDAFMVKKYGLDFKFKEFNFAQRGTGRK